MTARAHVHVEDRPFGVRVLTLNNPARRNAIDDDILDDLERAVEPRSTTHVRALLIRGAGGTFCSGYDLEALPSPSETRLPDDRLGEVLALVARHPAPSVALVTGAAFGAGCELACTCDLRVASDDAVFCMPPAKLGIVYAPEGLWKVARVVGFPKAKRMFFTGMRISAELAHTWGLCDERAPSPDEAEKVALQFCEEMAQNAPMAVTGMKRAFEDLSRVVLPELERMELREIRRAAFASRDAQEGRLAFRAKRKPAFKGE